MVRATIAAERAGFRSVCIVTTGFVEQARSVALAMGTADLSLVEYPGVVMTQSAEEVAKNVQQHLVAQIIYELTGS